MIITVCNPDPQETSRTATTAGKERNMSLIRRIGTLRTLSFAVGVTLGLVSAVYAQSGPGTQLPAEPSDPQEALDQWPIIAGYRQQPSAEEADLGRDERGNAPSTGGSAKKLAKCISSYNQIVRRTDPAIRP